MNIVPGVLGIWLIGFIIGYYLSKYMELKVDKTEKWEWWLVKFYLAVNLLFWWGIIPMNLIRLLFHSISVRTNGKPPKWL